MLALDIARQLLFREQRPVMACALLVGAGFMTFDNWRTLGRMRLNARAAAAKAPADCAPVKVLWRSVPSWPLWPAGGARMWCDVTSVIDASPGAGQ